MTKRIVDKEWHANYRKERYAKYISKWKMYLGNKCVKCDSTEDLQFDHIDPSTKYKNITEMTDCSELRQLEEIQKCQLLCRKHHDEKTIVIDTGRTLVINQDIHGTLSSYR